MVVSPATATPQWLLLPTVAGDRFAAVAAVQERLSTDRLEVRVAYSIKTNPDPRLIALAREHGLLVDAISQEEVAAARRAGFPAADIVLNGPAKWWPVGSAASNAADYRAVFCDSVPELAQAVAAAAGAPAGIGLRLRPTGVPSRFGIPAAALDGAAALLGETHPDTDLRVHFHYPGVVVGFARWWACLAEVVGRAATLERSAGRPVRLLDAGGGWHPLDWQQGWLASLGEFVRDLPRQLTNVRELIVEPGEALVQPTGVLLGRVLDVRPGDQPEVVVDASVAELPEARSYPHPVLVQDSAGRWSPTGPGRGRILGRLCMELDQLAAGVDVGDLRPGGLVAFGRAGSYDRSMSYRFGRG
jgi:diaminopimelate decarboxylase